MIDAEPQEPLPPRIEIPGPAGITLRQLYVEDAEAYFGLIDYDRAHLSQFNDETAEKYPSFLAVANSLVNPQNPARLRFGIWDGEVMVGSINLTPKDNRTAEIGYWVGKQHTGHGYASEAVKALSKYAFDQTEADLLFANVAVGNQASKRTLEKAGFILSDTFQGRDGQVWECILRKGDINRLTP